MRRGSPQGGCFFLLGLSFWAMLGGCWLGGRVGPGGGFQKSGWVGYWSGKMCPPRSPSEFVLPTFPAPMPPYTFGVSSVKVTAPQRHPQPERCPQGVAPAVVNKAATQTQEAAGARFYPASRLRTGCSRTRCGPRHTRHPLSGEMTHSGRGGGAFARNAWFQWDSFVCEKISGRFSTLADIFTAQKDPSPQDH